jgi:hypothetical protein
MYNDPLRFKIRIPRQQKESEFTKAVDKVVSLAT